MPPHLLESWRGPRRARAGGCAAAQPAAAARPWGGNAPRHHAPAWPQWANSTHCWFRKMFWGLRGVGGACECHGAALLQHIAYVGTCGRGVAWGRPRGSGVHDFQLRPGAGHPPHAQHPHHTRHQGRGPMSTAPPSGVPAAQRGRDRCHAPPSTTAHLASPPGAAAAVTGCKRRARPLQRWWCVSGGARLSTGC